MRIVRRVTKTTVGTQSAYTRIQASKSNTDDTTLARQEKLSSWSCGGVPIGTQRLDAKVGAARGEELPSWSPSAGAPDARGVPVDPACPLKQMTREEKAQQRKEDRMSIKDLERACLSCLGRVVPGRWWESGWGPN